MESNIQPLKSYIKRIGGNVPSEANICNKIIRDMSFRTFNLPISSSEVVGSDLRIYDLK